MLVISASKYQSIIDAALTHSKQRKLREFTPIERAGLHVSEVFNYTLLYDVVSDCSPPIAGYSKSKNMLALVQNEETNFEEAVFFDSTKNKTYYINSQVERQDNVRVYRIKKINFTNILGYYHLKTLAHEEPIRKTIEWGNSSDNLIDNDPTFNIIPWIYQKVMNKIQEMSENLPFQISTEPYTERNDEHFDLPADQYKYGDLQGISLNAGMYIDTLPTIEITGFSMLWEANLKVLIDGGTGFTFELENEVILPGLYFIFDIPIYGKDITILGKTIAAVIKAQIIVGCDYIRISLPITYSYKKKYQFVAKLEYTFTSSGAQEKERSTQVIPFTEKSELPEDLGIKEILKQSSITIPLTIHCVLMVDISFPNIFGISIEFDIIEVRVPIKVSYDETLCAYPYLYISLAATFYTSAKFHGITLFNKGPYFAKDPLYDFQIYQTKVANFCLVQNTINEEVSESKIFTNDLVSLSSELYVSTTKEKSQWATKDPKTYKKLVAFSLTQDDKLITSKVYPLSLYTQEYEYRLNILATDLPASSLNFKMNAITTYGSDKELPETLISVNSNSNEIKNEYAVAENTDAAELQRDSLNYWVKYKSGVRIAVGKVYKRSQKDHFVVFEANGYDTENCIWTQSRSTSQYSLSSTPLKFDTAVTSRNPFSSRTPKLNDYRFAKIKITKFIQYTNFRTNLYLSFIDTVTDIAFAGFIINTNNLEKNIEYSAEDINIDELYGSMELTDHRKFKLYINVVTSIFSGSEEGITESYKYIGGSDVISSSAENLKLILKSKDIKPHWFTTLKTTKKVQFLRKFWNSINMIL